MTLYTYFRSSASYRVRIALHLKGIKFESRFVHLKKGSNNEEEYRQINPMRQVPVLHDGDVQLSQSMAIFSYLDSVQSSPLLFPEDALLRAQTIQIAENINAGIQPIQNLAVLHHIGDEFGADASAKSKWCKHWIHRGFVGLEKQLEKTSGQFCVGDEVTAADLCLVPQVYNANRFKVEMSEFPIITRIHKACEEIPAFQKAHPNNQGDFEE